MTDELLKVITMIVFIGVYIRTVDGIQKIKPVKFQSISVFHFNRRFVISPVTSANSITYTI